MDVCSWDWGAIAGFMGAGATIYAAHVALSISNQWKVQKRSEIISDMAKKAYEKRISTNEAIGKVYIATYSLIHKNNIGYTAEQQKELLQNSFKEFSSHINSLSSELDIISKYKKNESIKNNIDTIQKDRDKISNLLLDIHGTYLCSHQLTLEQENNFSMQLFDITENIKNTINSEKLDSELISYILHHK